MSVSIVARPLCCSLAAHIYHPFEVFLKNFWQSQVYFLDELCGIPMQSHQCYDGDPIRIDEVLRFISDILKMIRIDCEDLFRNNEILNVLPEILMAELSNSAQCIARLNAAAEMLGGNTCHRNKSLACQHMVASCILLSFGDLNSDKPRIMENAISNIIRGYLTSLSIADKMSIIPKEGDAKDTDLRISFLRKLLTERSKSGKYASDDFTSP
jgi:hypothetical protein